MTIEEVAREENLREAFRKVASNDGAPGPDRQTVEQVQQRLDAIVPVLSRELTTGEYRPGDIRRVWIPKTGGGERGLGIPNVIDRIAVKRVDRGPGIKDPACISARAESGIDDHRTGCGNECRDHFVKQDGNVRGQNVRGGHHLPPLASASAASWRHAACGFSQPGPMRWSSDGLHSWSISPAPWK